MLVDSVRGMVILRAYGAAKPLLLTRNEVSKLVESLIIAQGHSDGFAEALLMVDEELAAEDGTREVDCLHCGNVWTTRAKPGNSTGCPKCKKPRRISTKKDGNRASTQGN